MKSASLIKSFNGGFDDCAISGDWFELPDGQRFWSVTVVSADNYRSADQQINTHCLISSDSIRCFNAGVTFPDFTPVINSRVDIGATALGSVLAEIYKWEAMA